MLRRRSKNRKASPGNRRLRLGIGNRFEIADQVFEARCVINHDFERDRIADGLAYRGYTVTTVRDSAPTGSR